ncbi:hypothetical protein [Craterilacuibacter sinensis]|uniref:Replication protein n=1 Tax=Craterilacuibacter sinensis TaxID=2686017 RepID=A0A845BPD2_9NEIS|nr:hypothetical protein [Craterilacuibacter sinensis]MXR37240.1 hypothetical protein [Craterilacuibacter sinensis]
MSNISVFDPQAEQQPRKAHPSAAAYVLSRFSSIYRGRLDKSLPSVESVRAWVAEMDHHLKRCRISREQIDMALQRAVDGYEWPPLEVPVFLQLCSKLPDLELAFSEVQRYAYARQMGEVVRDAQGREQALSHPALHWAADRLGWDVVRNSSYKKVTKRWREAVDEVMQWPSWPSPTPLRITDAGGLRTAGAHRQAMEEARRILKQRHSA